MQCCYSVGSETPLNCRGASVGDSKTVHVVGAIIEREGTVFAARRNPERSAGGLWEFPGGKVELGESPEQALRREVLEELGIGITVGRLIDRSRSEEHTSELQSRGHLVCRLLLEKKTIGVSSAVTSSVLSNSLIKSDILFISVNIILVN